VTFSAALAALECLRATAPGMAPGTAAVLARAAAAFASGSSAGPSPLPARAVTLAEAATEGMPLSRAAVMLVALGALFLGAVVLASSGSPAAPPGAAGQAPKPQGGPARAGAAPKKEAAAAVPGRVSVRGDVRDTSGKPVSGAAVYLRERPVSRTSLSWHPTRTRNLARARTDDQGRFAFDGVPLPPPEGTWRDSSYPLDVIVRAEGYALAWQALTSPPGGPVPFRLAAEGRVQGRLVDRDGKPVAGAAVRVREIAAVEHGYQAPLDSPGYVDLQWADVPLTATSDAGGRFTLGGLPRNRRAALVISAAPFLTQEVLVATTAAPQPPLRDSARTRDGRSSGPACPFGSSRRRSRPTPRRASRSGRCRRAS
jgi:hypothetical protein